MIIDSDDEMVFVLSGRESINTLTYLVLIMMAYFGPNAELLGNIKAKIWQFERPISDIEAYAMNVCILLAVDLLSFMINSFCISARLTFLSL